MSYPRDHKRLPYSLWWNVMGPLHRISILCPIRGTTTLGFHPTLYDITQDINLCPIRGTTTVHFHPTLYDRMWQFLYAGHQFMSYPRDHPHWFSLLFMIECDTFFTQYINLCPIRGTTTLRFHPLYDKMWQVLHTGPPFYVLSEGPPHWVFTLLFMIKCDKFFTQDLHFMSYPRDHHTKFSPYSLW